MALKLLSVWGRVPRPWGYEVRVDFVDEAGAIRNEVLTFEREPDEKQLDAAVAALADSLTARIAAEAAMVMGVDGGVEEELAVKVAALEVEKAALTAERDALVAEKEALPIDEKVRP
jgi:hypothetical protein